MLLCHLSSNIALCCIVPILNHSFNAIDAVRFVLLIVNSSRLQADVLDGVEGKYVYRILYSGAKALCDCEQLLPSALEILLHIRQSIAVPASVVEYGKEAPFKF